MPVYMVERVLPGASVDCLEAIRRAAQKACRAFTSEGQPVRYLRSTFTPGESCCRCLFEAPNSDLVREVNEAMKIPYSRVVLAVEFPGEAPAESLHSCSPDSHQ